MQKRTSAIAGVVDLALLCCVACQSQPAAAPSSQIAAGSGGAPELVAPAASNGNGVAGMVAPVAWRAAAASTAPAGSAAPAMAAAGSGNVAAAGSGQSGPDVRGAAALPCELPPESTRANRLTLDLTWPATLGIEAGSGTLIAWSKLKYIQQADGTTRTESRSCGSLTPTVMTTALVGSLKSAAQVPLSAYDQPSMPMYQGAITGTGATLVFDPGAMVVGAVLSDATAAWPAASALTTFDHDADGAPGLTALPITGDGYFTPPSSVSQTDFLDRVYIASRIRLKVSLTRNHCSSQQQASVEPISFDYTVVGCHVKDRDDCTADETRFLATQSPKFMLGKAGTWVEAEVAASATCTDVRAALPAP
jgi:hypothetical protein